jgi:CHAT domain-containing protein
VDQVRVKVRSLGQRILAPLALSPAVRRLLVSPVAELGFVPYGMLGDGLDIVLTPSGTVHGLLSGQEQARGHGVLALGDPVYEMAGSSAGPGDGRRGGTRLKLERLLASAEEASAVGTDVLLRERANESALVTSLAARPRWRAVHLACHGLVDPERAMFSALALTPDAEQDGFLTALEILRLRAPTDLVVLSACNTGRGRAYKTEGIVGLTRAFFHAGASRVLCSLWKVDDAATSALMRRFYELWNPEDGSEGLPAARALREAQAYVGKQPDWEHPHYWAAWVLWGLP